MFSNDIFLSFDFDDDAVSDGSKGGLITAFHDLLVVKLNQKLGRRPTVFFEDRRIPGGSDLGTQLREAVRDSAVLIVFHSVSYEGSDWCQKELLEFCDANPAFDGRLFIVSLSPEHLPEDSVLIPDWLAVYRKLFYRKGGRHFRMKPDDPKQVNVDEFTLEEEASVLASDIAAKLKELEARPEPKAKAFLSCVGADRLKKCARDIAKHLEQHQIEVVRSSPWIEDGELRRATAQAAMDECDLFVGIVDEGAPESSQNPETVHGQEQHEVIMNEGGSGELLPAIRWMSKELRGHSAEELDRLRSEPNVIRDQLQAFKSRVVATLEEMQQQAALHEGNKARNGKKFFLVMAAEADRDNARLITSEISERRMGRDLVLDQHDEPGEIQPSGEDWRNNLKQLVKAYQPAALLFVDGDCPGAWIDDRLRACVLLQGDFPVDPEIGVCEFPPVPKTDRDCRPEDRVRFFSANELTHELDRLTGL